MRIAVLRSPNSVPRIPPELSGLYASATRGETAL